MAKKIKNDVDFSKVRWMGYDWFKQEDWGIIHPDKPNKYNSYDCVKISNNQLILSIKYSPRTIVCDDNTILKPDFGIGLVTCLTKFTYGAFEIDAKLPIGRNLWPSFWAYSWKTWPPEIDIFEGYSVKNGKYFNFKISNVSSWWRKIFRWNLESNYHVNSDDKSKNVDTWSVFDTKKNPCENFINYKLIWTPQYIEWVYDNKVIRHVEDPEIINMLNETKELRIILNNSCTNDYTKKDFNNYKTDFIIDKFLYTPYSL